ncbi:hypothetical protein G7Y79_00024g055930 [Physcia stellaris]|nr:hypothetical protein G7Y79_00024g055930 [Physcia stellaris]
MPRWQKRFTCFYCGCRSATSLPADTRRWECKKCEAVNHLDKNGEITDPPVTASQPGTRFAKARPRSESPPGLVTREESPFCQRCLQNQIIVKDILAEYTPPSTADWEKSYKTYVQDLQETYPPVCEGCETNIREKMKHSDYFVDADNLGRALKKPNESWVDRRGWQYDLASLLLTLGKLMWFMSWIGQSLWHVINLIKPKEQLEGLVDELEYLWDDSDSPSVSSCASQVFRMTPLQKFCDELFASLVGWSLVLGVLSIWWNPMWVMKMKLVYGRPAGRKEFYQLQAMFLALRWAGWNFIANPGAVELDAQQWKGLHAFMLAVTLLSAFLPYRTIRWDSTPRILRNYSPGSLLAQEPRKPRATSRPDQPDFTSQAQQNFGSNRSNRSADRFPINQLAPPRRPQQPFIPQYNPPTPPRKTKTPWIGRPPGPKNNSLCVHRSLTATPAPSPNLSQKQDSNPNPQPLLRPPPPNPVSQAHALRNPPYRPGPMERASAQQHNFFSRNKPKPSQMFKNARLHDDAESETASPASTRFGERGEDELSPVKFGAQKFFPGNVYGMDTGIEDLFAKATTLGDADQRAERRLDGGARDEAEGEGGMGRGALVVWSVPVMLAVVGVAVGVRMVWV